MKLVDFDYNLPKELIAQYPAAKREHSRLLVLDRKNETIRHLEFSDISGFVSSGDLLVLNNTKVLPARLFGIREKTGAKIEFLLIKRQGNVFSAMVKPAKKFVDGETILFDNKNGGLRAKITGKNKLEFTQAHIEDVYKAGVMPLPPYIKRQTEFIDLERYQTVFAKHPGSIAAPTAGLHFTKDLVDDIRERGVDVNYVTLHVGVGTFKPVKCDDVSSHSMEAEYFEAEEELINKIKAARQKEKKVFAVGTTACRTIETLFNAGYSSSEHVKVDNENKCVYGWTNLFIYPGYRFKAVDCLLTNFHLPKSTLFMLVCAFAGRKLAIKTYNQAIKSKYRFYSYGDAMLII
ncbi:MAG: tRNA preQ1(34) S-adenosylmethionine ribosyltransferase-isomerase QueA [Candidatus Omnitrophica bacterium CG11_big_fil_rev_8_21_14_0_20_42_13]|uniref:S-adenosylmethionine:tRNA ribosyltransferase-isomerase n=1 Tax=Candidatus Ghiorseimicrobium undicola TaxID=1974746 RepID=A0A2H0LWS4_9BACT|nr:MAG: tRNA preQ1(34) S-adenosylmethionine ribosyltransferase-isomerase QueA [Candidatus Omnitrophica bacterium CG11_big_fil_rev_8_21_14_0_20_42_13]